jgi:hypothetical protein
MIHPAGCPRSESVAHKKRSHAERLQPNFSFHQEAARLGAKKVPPGELEKFQK